MMLWILIAVTFLTFHQSLYAQHEINLPGVGLFGDADGAFIDVIERPNGASIHVYDEKASSTVPTYLGSWPADSWSKISFVEHKIVGDRVARVLFSPYKTSDSIPIPRPGSFMVVPPAEDDHSFAVQPTGFCTEPELPTCSGDFFLTYDVARIPAPLPGDADVDGRVGFADFLRLSNHFGNAHLSFTWDDGDFDLNRQIDMNDFRLLSQNFGATRQLAAVPEPCGLGAVFFGILSAVIVNRKRNSR